jgi:hypothetical protein
VDDLLTDRVLQRVQALYPELNASRNPREAIVVPELGYLDGHLYDPDDPVSGRIPANSLKRKAYTHIARFNPTDDSSLDDAVHDAVAYLRNPLNPKYT